MLTYKRVLMCINEPGITEVLTLTLEKEFAHKYDLSIAETRYIDKLLAHAQKEAIDLFILLLNNMVYSDVKLCPAKRGADFRLDVIAQLRRSYQKPVIALTGLPLRYTEQNTKEAGASFLFVLPVEGRPLMDAVKQCFEETEPAHL